MKYTVKAIQKYTSYQILDVEVEASSVSTAKLIVRNGDYDSEPEVYDIGCDQPEFTDIDKWEVTRKPSKQPINDR